MHNGRSKKGFECTILWKPEKEKTFETRNGIYTTSWWTQTGIHLTKTLSPVKIFFKKSYFPHFPLTQFKDFKLRYRNSSWASFTASKLWLEDSVMSLQMRRNEPPHDRTNKLSVRPVWSESSLSAWRNIGSLVTHWAHSEYSYQIGRMPRLVWVFAGRTTILLVFSCCGSLITSTRLKAA